MDRHNKLLQNDELYFQCGEMIKENIVSIQKHIYLLRNYLGKRKREIVKEISGNDERNKTTSLECTQQFYKETLDELVKVEQVCEEYLLRMKIDLLTAGKSRLQPPSYVSPNDVRKAYETCSCNDLFVEEEFDEKSCCIWRNVAKGSLEETQNILGKPKRQVGTEFDESDLKFKQEITRLRTKMFTLPETQLKSDFTKAARRKQSFALLPNDNKLVKISNLKFVDGEFMPSDIWTRILDTHGNQLSSKWHLILRPQIENIMMKRRIPVLRLNPRLTFDFLSNIRENGANFFLLKEDLIPLVDNKSGISCLKSWKLQFHMIDGNHTAATVIQKFWRGYWLRKKIWETERRYIAASVIWFSWIALRKKREMHERYLTKMLISLHITRDLSLTLSNNFNHMIETPHVILHLPSLGYPLDIRRTFAPKMFAAHQNMTSLRISFVRNPKAEVVYVLPVQPTEDLLMMYSDVIESVSPEEHVAKRITFIALSQTETFRNRSFNVSRILHCSEESLQEIRKKIAGKSAYFLPWIIDECDMRLVGNLGVPLLSPDMELQKKFLDMSKITEIIESLGLLQPPHKRNINDYDTLCTSMAELIVLHTEVCLWLIRLNFGAKAKHYGIFLINHISIPFMPILRREREKHGELWRTTPELRKEFLECLMDQLPKVVSSVTRLPTAYTSWKEFYAHIQKFGCLLQAVPVEKNGSIIVVSLFIPGKDTGDMPKWTGTADRIHLDSASSTFTYLIPQTSFDTSKLEPVVTQFAKEVQNQGYFGYLTVDCYCYPHKHEDKLIILFLNVHPYYSYLQSYIDWITFAIGGSYSYTTNAFTADVTILPEVRKRKTSYLLLHRIPKWNETTERYAIVISHLYHARFCNFRWSKLKAILEDCGITYDAKKKEGAHFILHDGEMRNFAMMVIISPNMTTTLSMAHSSLKKLYRALAFKLKKKPETNLLIVINMFSKLSLEYENLAADQCA